MRELAFAPAKFPIEREKVHRGVVYADADARLAHRGDEPGAGKLLRQDDLKHVPVRALEILDRQLAAEGAVPEPEVALGQGPSSFGEPLQVRELAEADARRDVGEVRLAAGDVAVHAILARAGDALQAELLRQRNKVLGRQHQRAAFGGGDVLVGVEAEGDEIAERADRLALPARAERMRRVLDDAEIAGLGDGIELVAIDGQSREIHRDDGLGVFFRFNQRQIDVPGLGIHVDEYRPCANLENDVGGRHPRERRGDHLVARPHAGEPQRDLHGDGARAVGAHRAAAAVLGERRLEGARLRSGGDPA